MQSQPAAVRSAFEYRILVGLMLSAQTKEFVGARAISRLQTGLGSHGLSVAGTALQGGEGVGTVGFSLRGSNSIVQKILAQAGCANESVPFTRSSFCCCFGPETLEYDPKMGQNSLAPSSPKHKHTHKHIHSTTSFVHPCTPRPPANKLSKNHRTFSHPSPFESMSHVSLNGLVRRKRGVGGQDQGAHIRGGLPQQQGQVYQAGGRHNPRGLLSDDTAMPSGGGGGGGVCMCVSDRDRHK